MSNFIEKCLSQAAAPEDIDDFIDQWHDNPGTQTLHDFLGMTRDEYAQWLTNSAALQTILKSRQSPANCAPPAPQAGPGA
ncbi:hypothetical protein GJ699_32700 [Duganella sp. FT80W]|uniref:Uncharacterized protein n=1 Tax=Duganella guangzhouensis TaxID=2666084 RepID=A0A6I2LD26_9BURK|nr:hypothetical protein [Duganella guangzhouensis]MRW94734.1 hypothetical protein [Duganella guangzhouensis]